MMIKGNDVGQIWARGCQQGIRMGKVDVVMGKGRGCHASKDGRHDKVQKERVP